MNKMRVAVKMIILSAAVLAFAGNAGANNLSIDNVKITGQNKAIKCVEVSFDISWDNSWKNEDSNFDAVWLFAKYYDYNDYKWKHVKLGGGGLNPPGFLCGQGTSLDVLLPDSFAKGCFFQRGEDGAGSISNKDAQIIWDYSGEAISDEDAGEAPIKVFGIEMVYIPTDEFYIGDGDGVNESVKAFHGYADGAVVDNTTVKITAAPVDITWDEGPQITVDGDDGIKYLSLSNIDWPTGFRSYYIMKYEVSQSQYSDFLNTLSYSEQRNHVSANPSGNAGKYAMTGAGTVTYREIIKIGYTYPFSNLRYYFGCDYAENNNNGDNILDQYNDGQCIAMHYMRWQDLCAYADWACLRPLTELEFEKAARGTGLPVYQDKPWGNTDLTKAVGPVSDQGEADEHAAISGNGLCNYNYGINGPLRGGFAQEEDTTRVEAGCGCFGALDLAGNINERYVTIGSSYGRLFQGTHGDGVLTTASGYEGNATNNDWPGIDASVENGVTQARGSGFRGGGFHNTENTLQVSDRTYASYSTDGFIRGYGGRLGRTTPPMVSGTGTFTETNTETGSSIDTETTTLSGTSSGTGSGTGTGTETGTSSSSQTATATDTESEIEVESYVDTNTGTNIW